MARNSLKNVMKLVDEAKKVMPIEESFLFDLKRSIELDDSKIARKPSQTYKPSSMNCIRNMFYQVVGKEQDEGSSSYVMVGICNAGTDIHARVQSYVSGMKGNNFDCEYVDVPEFIKSRQLDYLEVREQHGYETKLYHKSLNMSFMVDGIIKYQNHYYILEIKTETVNKWYKRTGVDKAHYNQATAYSLSLGINDVLFVYVNRDILDMSSYLFHVTDEMKQELVGKIELCDQYIKEFKVPPKPDVDKKVCEYCSYKSACRRDP